MTESPTRHRGRELAVSVLVVVILGVGVVWNMPVSPIQRALATPLQPVALGAGLDQRWQMYAPNPIRRTEDVEVVVTMADGSARTWTNPRGDLVLGPFVWYRWQKLKENLVRDPNIRAGVAHWAITELTQPNEKPQKVQIVLSTEQLPPPGQRHSGETATEVLYDEDLTAHP